MLSAATVKLDIERKEMESYLTNKALEELLLEAELEKEIMLENKIHDVSMAHLLAYGTPYTPTFVFAAP